MSEFRTSTVDGQTFVHVDSGEGPLLVLLHGFPDTPHSWDIGHDWGASIVYAAAHLHPERARAIVAIAIPPARLLRPTPGLLFRTRHFVALRTPWAESTVRRRDFAYVDTLYTRWAPNWSGPARAATLAAVKACFRDPVALQGAVAYYRAWSPRESLAVAGRLAVPGLVVGGTRDVIDAAAFREGPSGFDARCEVLVVDGAGHWPHREAEDRFMDRLLPFLRSL